MSLKNAQPWLAKIEQISKVELGASHTMANDHIRAPWQTKINRRELIIWQINDIWRWHARAVSNVLEVSVKSFATKQELNKQSTYYIWTTQIYTLPSNTVAWIWLECDLQYETLILELETLYTIKLKQKVQI